MLRQLIEIRLHGFVSNNIHFAGQVCIIHDGMDAQFLHVGQHFPLTEPQPVER